METKKHKHQLKVELLMKKQEHASTLSEIGTKQAELNGLVSVPKIKKLGLAALIVYGACITLGVIACVVGGSVSTPFTILCVISFIAYGFLHAVFCSFHSRNEQFAFLNIPTLGLFGLTDILIRIKRAPFMKGKYQEQIAKLSEKEEKLQAEIDALTREIAALNQNGNDES